MNTANLQLEGVLLVLSRILETLRRKGLLTEQEISTALAEAEDAARRDAANRTISPGQAEGVLFPIRFLKAATNLAEGPALTFSDTTALVTEAKHR
ncbi:hypothetical protein ABLE93_03520 [Xanthobacter sp. KR7-65]|uniref:hypothetical protein n=1 Tax=Xanthobacter sp. KR7-65 TaxID=3156612 RepID=UPI0032B5D1BE